MKQNDCLIVLDKSGTMLSSEKFSKFLNEKMINQTRRICFLIGSEIGLDDFFKSLKCFFIWKSNMAAFNYSYYVNRTNLQIFRNFERFSIS